MTDFSQPHLSTRRSFIKKSIVAGVAVSSMTIFSGLVNAQGESTSPSGGCKLTKTTECKLEPVGGGGQKANLCQAKCEPNDKLPDGSDRRAEFTVHCNGDDVPLNDGWYTNTEGCDAPSS